MLQILCSSVRVKLLARAKLLFLREQPDDFFSVGNPVYCLDNKIWDLNLTFNRKNNIKNWFLVSNLFENVVLYILLILLIKNWYYDLLPWQLPP